MDVLVLLEECDDDAAVRAPADPRGERPVAYVHSAPDPRAWMRASDGRGPAHGREVVTLCGVADAGRLAAALAAAIEGRRAEAGPASAVRHLGVWEHRGASGDCAWRDGATGQVMSRDVAIPASTIEATARRLLADAGRLLQQTVAELATADWPEGSRRAISFSLPTADDRPAGRLGIAAELADDALLASLREADGDGGAEAAGGDVEADAYDLPGGRAA